MTQFILRPITIKDLPQLKELIAGMDSQIASLPNDKKLLKQRILLSQRSFKKETTQPSKEYYLFVLEDRTTKKIIGTSAIAARVGGQNFFFVYKIRKEAFSYLPLNISKSVDVLHFQKINRGPSELCSLYLNSEFRKQGLGTMLSFGRYFFINAFHKRFTTEIVANLKGFRDEQKHSPFWEVIGKFFFSRSLATIDTMKSLGHKTIIRALMPKHPIYIPLLPKDGQEVIGEVSTDTQPALHMLEKIGFRKSDWVDILDAGPFLIAKRNEIKVIQNMHSGKINGFIQKSSKKKVPEYMIGNNLIDFRACMGDVSSDADGNVQIDSDVAEVLNVQVGSIISYVKY